MEGRDYGDNQILQLTVQEKHKDNLTVRFKTDLPGTGRTVVSEWMDQDQAKGQTMMSWCENIRQQIDADAQEKRARKKHDRDMQETVEEIETKQELAVVAQDPLEYAEHQRGTYKARVDILRERRDATIKELATMEKHLRQWDEIIKSLTTKPQPT